MKDQNGNRSERETDPSQGLASAKDTAEALAKDTKRTSRLLQQARDKAQKHRKSLQQVWEDWQALLRLIRAWSKGDYSQVPWRTLVLALAAMVYFVNPLDVLPDFLPATGLVDDATVIGFVVKSIKQDIDLFLEWESGREPV